ncbi:LysR family transcriptional regulator [Oceanicoccus sp. KOV_DT_Chl]|uniref:LysR family transcriptional regulator n=1 Tax=Oceanicoccus sp. KOV_DT_Chl TaxID=1904639 RepID=UPI000C7C84DD|nr:LysR family transcriptional regulator [Oceanicoccus sp. KOV_DT_Chl]
MLNWNDLKYLLATVQSGSFSNAARELGVNRTTVARRIATLEKQLATPLLEQSAGGLQLTSAGEEAIASARHLQQQVDGLEQRISATGGDVAGSLRVAAPLGLGPEFIPELAQFSTLYPHVTVELLNTVDPMASINQRKADVGIGVGHQLPDYLTGISVGELQRAIYAAKSYLKKHKKTLPYSEQQWVGWGRDLAHSHAAQWMQRYVAEEAIISLRVNSWHALREAVTHGVGVGQLWCFLAKQEKSLVQISEVIDELEIGLWVFNHTDIQNNRRVAAFIEVVAPLLATRIR